MKRNSIFLFIVILFSSCAGITKFAFKTMGVFDENIKPKTLKNREKDLIFLPMHHIGKDKFYQDARRYVDSMHKLGFVVFYEYVKFAERTDYLSKDTLYRKTRKIIGSLGGNGYIDRNDSTFAGKKFKFLKELVNQPLGSAIGLDSAIDKNVDVTLNELIRAYEEKYQIIVLDECDFQTGIKDKYGCNKIRDRKGNDFLLMDYRNEFLANQIINSAHTKIAVMYGAKHFEGLFKILHSKDSTWSIQ